MAIRRRVHIRWHRCSLAQKLDTQTKRRLTRELDSLLWMAKFPLHTWASWRTQGPITLLFVLFFTCYSRGTKSWCCIFVFEVGLEWWMRQVEAQGLLWQKLNFMTSTKVHVRCSQKETFKCLRKDGNCAITRFHNMPRICSLCVNSVDLISYHNAQKWKWQEMDNSSEIPGTATGSSHLHTHLCDVQLAILAKQHLHHF